MSEQNLTNPSFRPLEPLGWDPYFETQYRNALTRCPERESDADSVYVPGRVFDERRDSFIVRGPLISSEPLLEDYTARLSGRLRGLIAGGDAVRPVAGDWVVLRIAGSRAALIEAVCERRTDFSRKEPGERTVRRTVAANVDGVLLVQGLDGNYNPRRTERYLTAAYESGARPIIVLNKADLCDKDQLDDRLRETAAVALGAPLFAISAGEGTGIADLRSVLEARKTYACLGSSGAGKSTLINRLMGRDAQATASVRGGDAKGRHTTTARRLLSTPEGILLLDTPGLRELQLWSDGGDTAEGLAEAFADVLAPAAHCRFRDCCHEDEPGCAVQAAIASGELEASRLKAYRKMQRELRVLEARSNERAAYEEKHRLKRLHGTYRNIQREKRRRQGR